MTKPTVRVLEVFLRAPSQEIHGFDLIDKAGVRSGSLYPMLARLEGEGILESRWEDSDRPGPRRRLYRFSADGEPVARKLVSLARQRWPVPPVARKRPQGAPA